MQMRLLFLTIRRLLGTARPAGPHKSARVRQRSHPDTDTQKGRGACIMHLWHLHVSPKMLHAWPPLAVLVLMTGDAETLKQIFGSEKEKEEGKKRESHTWLLYWEGYDKPTRREREREKATAAFCCRIGMTLMCVSQTYNTASLGNVFQMTLPSRYFSSSKDTPSIKWQIIFSVVLTFTNAI